MSTPTNPERPVDASGSFHRGRTNAVPAPPGGHALRIDPSMPRTVLHSQSLPVVDEVSAGGLVVRRVDGEYQAAIIARRNRAGRLEWCLPKGHLEGTETPEEAAVREIAEETGIIGEIQAMLGVIDYWFSGDDRRVHKVVHHFLLKAIGGSLGVEGDPDGEAEEAAWVSIGELSIRLAYPNERRLAALAGRCLADGPSPVLRRYERITRRTIARIPRPGRGNGPGRGNDSKGTQASTS